MTDLRYPIGRFEHDGPITGFRFAGEIGAPSGIGMRLAKGILLLCTFTALAACDLFKDEREPVRRQMIIFASDWGEGDNLNLWMMTPQGENLRQLTHYPEGDVLPADISPDGTKILFYRLGDTARNEGLFIMDVDGPEPSQEERLVFAWANFRQGGGSFFPDGQRFVYEASFTFGIYDMEDSTSVQIDPGHLGFDPEVSPDGSKICYTVETGDVWQTKEIFLMAPDGSNARTLTPHEGPNYALNCGFSADGTKVLYSQDGLRWVDLEGGESHRIPGEIYGRHLTTDTSGTRVFFRRPSGLFPKADAEIMAVDFDGSGLERLTHDDFVDERPVVGVVEFLP